MAVLSLTSDRLIDRYAGALDALPAKARSQFAIALNSGGRAIRQATIAAETAQTGLKRATLARAQRERRASPSNLAYTIASGGGNVRLTFFGARETPAGVSAAPWNARHTYAGSFMKGGRFPKRVPLKSGGAVFVRTGRGRLPLLVQRSGLFIPTEMVTGDTAAAFHAGTPAVEGVVLRRLGRLLP